MWEGTKAEKQVGNLEGTAAKTLNTIQLFIAKYTVTTDLKKTLNVD